MRTILFLSTIIFSTNGFSKSLVPPSAKSQQENATATSISKPKIILSRDEKKAAAGQKPYTCKGSFLKPDVLLEIGYLDQEIRQGLPCESTDFDENGQQDFFFRKCDANLKCKSKVVLMKDHEVLGTVSLKLAGLLSVLAVKSEPAHASLKEIGCKFPTAGALVEMGDGDGKYSTIYSLNKSRTEFIKFSDCVSVDGGE